jgi:hypothetical protein
VPKSNFGIPDETIFFCLARGYKGFRKHQYKKLILRNLYLNKFLDDSRAVNSIIFHEGNMTNFDQFLIRIFSRNFQIKFESIEQHWIRSTEQEWTGKSAFGLGYSLMCRFNYAIWWRYFDAYKYAVRVDDDVLLIHTGHERRFTYKCAKLYPETHVPTNLSFPIFLEGIGLLNSYNHKFPPNCFYFTDLAFWNKPAVAHFLDFASKQPKSLEDRWGDTVVMGTALNAFGEVADLKVDPTIEYMHLSHGLHIKNGEENYGVNNRVMIYLLAILRLIKYR